MKKETRVVIRVYTLLAILALAEGILLWAIYRS